MNNAYAHNSVYRGKDLGSGVTAEMSAAIREGTFEDIYPGDYFTKAIPAYTWTDWEGNTHEEKASASAMIWDIVGCNPLIHETPHAPFRTNHIGVVPRGSLYAAPMNEEDTTAGGYYGSDMFNKHLKRAEAIVKAVFGEEHILTHVDTLCNAVTDGEESGWATYGNRVVDIMSEYMCFGRKFRWSAEKGSYDHGSIAHSQLPLYQFRPDLAGHYGAYSWLREAVDSESFAVLTTWGGATYHKASNPNNWAGVRPLFLVY